MKITANRLTFLRILLLPLPCLLLYGGPGAKLTALGLGSLLGLTDYFDGKLARQQGITRLGTFLDPIADKIFIATLYFFLARLGFLPLWLVAGLLLREFLVSALRPRVPGSLPVVWLAKVKTTFQMLGAALLVALAAFPQWAFWFFLAAALLLMFGALISRASIQRKLFLYGVAGLLPFLVLLPREQASLVLGLGVLAITWLSAWPYLQKGFSAVKGARREVLGEVFLPTVVLFLSSSAGVFGLLVPLILVLFFFKAAFLLLNPRVRFSKEQFLLSLAGLAVSFFPQLVPAYLILVTFYFFVEVLVLSRKGFRELLA